VLDSLHVQASDFGYRRMQNLRRRAPTLFDDGSQVQPSPILTPLVGQQLNPTTYSTWVVMHITLNQPPLASTKRLPSQLTSKTPARIVSTISRLPWYERPHEDEVLVKIYDGDKTCYIQLAGLL
jgi:hypothetical protein